MRYIFSASFFFFFACYQPPAQKPMFDIIIRNGLICDGSGMTPFEGDLAIQGDTIAAIGDLDYAIGKKEIDAKGFVVSPGFINVLSFADKSLLMDGRSMSNIKQGVTLELFGEGWSPGPVRRNPGRKADSLWTTLDGYFKWAMKKGVSPNIASLVGHTSIRNYVLGYEKVKPNAAQLDSMKQLVAEAMEQGAFGLGSSLIYPPASYSTTKELIELARVASQYGGIYMTHLRSEGDFIYKALDEAFRIGKEGNLPVEIYHLKLSIARNWSKIDTVLAKIDSAQRAGIKVTANVYPYIASATGLTARLPDWVQEGGAKEMRKRLKTPAIRKKVLYEMSNGIPYKNSDPQDVMILDFRLDSLDSLYRGKRLDDIARHHGKSADETVIDLVMKDKSRIESVYFLMSEDNLRKIIQQPYVSVGSDAASIAISDTFREWSAHPRAYGTFARIISRYVRDEKLITLQEAVRRMTSLPADNLGIKKRGLLKSGYYADVVIFDADSIYDHATFDNPHQYASGVHHVLVNGTPVLEGGQHTGALPGRVVYGPGKKSY